MRPFRRLPAALFIALALAACASTGAPKPAVNVTLAAQREGELEAAKAYRETTFEAAGAARAENAITADEFKRVRVASDELLTAWRVADAEHRLYVVAGSNLADYDDAFTDLAVARKNLGLVWEAVRR